MKKTTEKTEVAVTENPVVEPKKSNFFRDLIDSSNDASSKRFVGLLFATVFAACSIVSVAGVNLSDNALELIKMEGLLGVSILGLNGVQQIATAFKK